MKKLLIIDRDFFFLSCLKEFLEPHFEVYIAHHQANVFSLIKTIQPDLIICDLSWPNLYGYHILKNLRENLSHAHIPFIFLSCLSEWEERDRALKLGANQFLSKPVPLRQLLSAIHEQFNQEEAIAV